MNPQSNGNYYRPSLLAALDYLAKRIPILYEAPSNNRNWTTADLDAVASLIDRPATREQIALARIEGMVADGAMVVNTTHIRSLARQALGLPL